MNLATAPAQATSSAFVAISLPTSTLVHDQLGSKPGLVSAVALETSPRRDVVVGTTTVFAIVYVPLSSSGPRLPDISSQPSSLSTHSATTVPNSTTLQQVSAGTEYGHYSFFALGQSVLFSPPWDYCAPFGFPFFVLVPPSERQATVDILFSCAIFKRRPHFRSFSPSSSL